MLATSIRKPLCAARVGHAALLATASRSDPIAPRRTLICTIWCATSRPLVFVAVRLPAGSAREERTEPRKLDKRLV